ncbi:MAG: alpha/beta fold hydrolase [Aeromicrobium sp.]|uniref:alpha/beta fold hydrolase n=1 Tax=Aeromicrobium sp. TaxID=1871063 RepID=UPI0039E6AEAD
MTDTLAGVRPDWVDDDLFPFESRFMEIDGNVVHHVDEGPRNGPTLLFLHGNPTWSFLFREVVGALREDVRCVALDYPGFGLSTAAPGYRHYPEDHAAVVTGVVDALGLTGVTLVGQDWGGPIGLTAALRRPEAFERLVFANTWAWSTNGDPWFELASRVGGAAPMRLLARRSDLVVNSFLAMGHRRRTPTTAEMTHYRRAQATPARRQAAALLPGRITGGRAFFAELEAGLPDLAGLPTLIVWGGADKVFRPKERERLEAAFPDHETVVVPDAGLYVPSDAPEEFAQAVRAWL